MNAYKLEVSIGTNPPSVTNKTPSRRPNRKPLKYINFQNEIISAPLNVWIEFSGFERLEDIKNIRSYLYGKEKKIAVSHYLRENNIKAKTNITVVDGKVSLWVIKYKNE